MACALLYINTELYLLTSSTVISSSDSMILWIASFSHPSFHLPLFSVYFFWWLEVMHVWFKLTCCTLRLNGGGMSTTSLFVCFHRCETFQCVFSEPIRKTGRCHRGFKPLLCSFFLGPPGGSYKLAGLSKNSPAKHHCSILPNWAQHSPILPLTEIFEDVLMKAV